MKKVLLKIFFLTGFALTFLPAQSSAKELWLKDIPVKKLQELYKECAYDGMKGYLMLPSRQYPAIFLKNFPKDYTSITDEQERNALFIKILAPLALKFNKDILADRQKIENLHKEFSEKGSLSAKETAFIEKIAEKYDLFSRLKDKERISYLLDELLNRVDAIPPSVMITAAAIETNWGTSRIVKEGNALYKEIVWHTTEGLEPIGETEDKTYRIKIFKDIYASLQSFALKLNSQPAFDSFRNVRRLLRERSPHPSGLILGPYLYGNYQLKNYAGMFDYTLAYYELLEIDKSSLADNMVSAEIQKDFQNYVTKM